MVNNINVQYIDITEVNKNIYNIRNGLPLTLPLRLLNRSCGFKEIWGERCNIEEGITLEEKERRRNYYHKPEVKERRKKYCKKYYQRPEVKERMREYYYNNKKKNE